MDEAGQQLGYSYIWDGIATSRALELTSRFSFLMPQLLKHSLFYLLKTEIWPLIKNYSLVQSYLVIFPILHTYVNKCKEGM